MQGLEDAAITDETSDEVDPAVARRQVLFLSAWLLVILSSVVSVIGKGWTRPVGIWIQVAGLVVLLTAVTILAVLGVNLFIRWRQSRRHPETRESSSVFAGRLGTILIVVAIVGGFAAVADVVAGRVVADRVRDRPQVAEVVGEWAAAQPVRRPLDLGGPPIVLVDEGDLSVACRLSGWPDDPQCMRSGLTPGMPFGSKPTLVAVDRAGDRYIAVLSYIDAADQVSPRWAGLVVTPGCGSWCVERHGILPFAAEPSTEQAARVLANVARCSPGSLSC